MEQRPLALRCSLFSLCARSVLPCSVIATRHCNPPQVVDDFLKVPGAKVFNVTKHKVTYHDVDSTPEPSPETASPEREDEDETATASASAEKDTPPADNEEGVEGDAEAPTGGVVDGEGAGAPEAETPQQVKRVRVRAVTELDRVVFLSRERVLVLACPGGPSSPGLVKSNHHLTELQKMTFMKRDPALVTLHYLAPERGGDVGAAVVAGAAAAAAASPATKRNVYRFDLDDKEAFIRILRGALQRFQA